MGFASTWLKEKTIFPEFIKEAPHKETGIIAVVPSYNEPGISGLISSLNSCDKPDCKVEVIIVINAPAHASPQCHENNRQTILNLISWKNSHSGFFSLHIIDTSSFRIDRWGVGMARKTGMDEAVCRFNRIDRPEGVILSLDADCTIEKNYLTSVNDELLKRKDRSACSIYFEHPLQGNDFTDPVYKSVTLYELHLRYYFQSLAFAGFPYVHHTVGSAMAVKALAYVKAGGMNRKMAGEDFYFIQKLVPAGGYFNLNLTTVYPSPRSSSRVPFGTGATISKLTGTKNDVLLTYNIKAFKDLKSVFSTIDDLFKCRYGDLGLLYSNLPEGFRQFISSEEWIEKIQEIKVNTKGLQSFKKRFFSWFNMFRIVKFLNSVHSTIYMKRSVIESSSELLHEIGEDLDTSDPLRLLKYYRILERSF